MGPNAVWLTEWLSQGLDLQPGMRVLDLGCGKALSSIFLAREFGVQVWAADWWLNPDGNWQRALEAKVAHAVFPVKAEAHALPFAAEFFDVILSIDAYQYFGTDLLYLNYLMRFLKPEGELGIVVPGLMQAFQTIPEHLAQPQSNGKVFWEDDCRSFLTADWWRHHWEQSAMITDVEVDTLADGCRHWCDFERALEASGKGLFPSDAEALEKDGGRFIGFVRARARRCVLSVENLYDPTIGLRFGLDS